MSSSLTTRQTEYTSVCNVDESTMLTMAPSLAWSAPCTGARRDRNVEMKGKGDFIMLTCFVKSWQNSCLVSENSPERASDLVFMP